MRIVLSLLFLCVCSAQTPTGITTHRSGSEPACDTARRGSMIVTLGEKGYPDLLKVCLRDGAGKYAWIAASQQSPLTFTRSRMVGGCPLFPDDNVWNSTIDRLPLDPASGGIIGTYGNDRLGTVPAFTLNVATPQTPVGPVQFAAAHDSDQGKYPVSGEMRVEGFGPGFTVGKGPYASDAHLLVLQPSECKLYEIFGLKSSTAPHRGESGAIYDLRANQLRPDGWTSADAAGLPIWPGVLSYDELYGEGEIRHMVRFSVNRTRNVFIWPARHQASRNGDPALPPMGSRWRLKASVDENVCRQNEHAGQPFPPEMRRLIRALKHYGMILADNGAAIRISTDASAKWGDGAPGTPEYELNGWTHCLTGVDFEVVDSSQLMVSPDSAAVQR